MLTSSRNNESMNHWLVYLFNSLFGPQFRKSQSIRNVMFWACSSSLDSKLNVFCLWVAHIHVHSIFPSSREILVKSHSSSVLHHGGARLVGIYISCPWNIGSIPVLQHQSVPESSHSLILTVMTATVCEVQLLQLSEPDGRVLLLLAPSSHQVEEQGATSQLSVNRSEWSCNYGTPTYASVNVPARQKGWAHSFSFICLLELNAELLKTCATFCPDRNVKCVIVYM